MQSIPKIVRNRLNAAPAVSRAGAHPDADVLTAFAEESLSERERASVLDHIARCGDCRDVLAFSLPPTETLDPTPVARGSAWFTWPALRWGFVSAGALAIIAFAVLQYKRLPPSITVALKQTQPYATGADETQNQPVPPPHAASEKRDSASRKKAEPKSPFVADTSSATAVPMLTRPKQMARVEPPHHAPVPRMLGGSLGGQIRSGPNMTTEGQQQYQAQSQQLPESTTPTVTASNNAQARSAPTPPISQTVEVTAESPAMNTSAAEISEAPVTNAVHGTALAKVDRAKPADALQAASATPSAGDDVKAEQKLPAVSGSAASNERSLTQFAQLQTTSSHLALWTISSAGTLQRSYDQGRTWLDVDVNTTANYTNLMSLDVAAKTTGAKEKDKNTKVLKAPLAIVFRAVASNGPDVWAGGSNGSLYHSLDAGLQWSRVTPSSTGSALTGDIISLEFSDALHGKVTTSSSEVWITADDGQTWQKQ